MAYGMIVFMASRVSGTNVFRSLSKQLTFSDEDIVGAEAFEDEDAKYIDSARIEHLENLMLPIDGKRVLDVGCGVGHWSDFFLNKNCALVSVDARPENINIFRSHHPSTESHVLNVETTSLSPLGFFDIVFCYGLFYHLENPVMALRNMAAVCKEMLLLETLVMDYNLPLSRVVNESLSANQALRGIGHRPTPSYVVFLLNKEGFEKIYTPKMPPCHPDFTFEWRNNMDTTRDGNNLRCIFVASKNKLENENLTNIL
ncbi:MAG: hypothetical protein A3C47_00570 [Omnitrophica bacterium RIFCSPHIGHO2_02_FULL_51_18]|nr:MAG: hypothetical protein A3C47_00570 [Omnitrophica bacterium RIFCSPHIGHO2_02_FULL_51_18]